MAGEDAGTGARRGPGYIKIVFLTWTALVRTHSTFLRDKRAGIASNTCYKPPCAENVIPASPDSIIKKV